MNTILSIFSSIVSILSAIFGKAVVVELTTVVNEGKKKDVLHNKPCFSWVGLSFFTRFHYPVAQKEAMKLAKEIKEKGGCPDLIIGIGRGGAVFGSMLSYRLENAPLLIVDRTYSWSLSLDMREDGILFNFNFPDRFKKNVLVVAGEYHSGKTMAYYCSYLRSIGVKTIRTCSFFVEDGRSDHPDGQTVDFCGKHEKGQPLMPWQHAGTIRDSISAADAMKLRRIISHRHKRIFIVRHGETPQNFNDEFIGITDVPLSDSGKQQASQAGLSIKQNLILESSTILLFSPMERCRETAAKIWEQLKSSRAQMRSYAGLRERNYGEWEGLSRNEIKDKYSDLYYQYENDPLNCTPVGADPMKEIIERVETLCFALNGIYDQNVILVTHKTTGRALISSLLKKPIETYREVPFGNGQVVIIDFFDGQYVEFQP